MLIATLLSHVNHGPFHSGRTLQTKQEVCESLVEDMTENEWQDLRERIASDRCVDVEDSQVPINKEQLLSEPTIASRGIFASRLTISNSLIQLYQC